jgi:hypothetical protein
MKINIALLTLIVFSQLFSRADQDIQARFERSLKAVKSIPGIEISWSDMLSIKDPMMLKGLRVKTNEFSRTDEYSYLVSGQKFRATSSLISGTETNLVHSLKSAFDGKFYYTYSDDSRYMTKKSSVNATDASEGGFNPLVQPFLFLKACFTSNSTVPLRFTDITSEQFTKDIVLPAAQISNGQLTLSMQGHMRTEGLTTWKIVMDEAGDYFTPETITEIVPDRKVEFVCRFSNYTNLLAYPFPARIEWVMNQYPESSPPTVSSSGLITVISAHIPDQISDSMFRFDNEEKNAAVIWNWDSQKLTKAAPRLAKIQTEHKATRIVILLLLFTTVVILPLSIIVMRKSEAGKK